MVHWSWKILEIPQRNILEVFYMERSKELSVWNIDSTLPQKIRETELYILYLHFLYIFRYGHFFTTRFLLIFIWSPTKSLSSHQICWTDWSWFLEEFHEWTKNWSHGGIEFFFHKLKFQCRSYVITFCPFFEIGFHRWRFNWNIFGLEQRQNGGSSFGNKYQR